MSDPAATFTMDDWAHLEDADRDAGELLDDADVPDGAIQTPTAPRAMSLPEARALLSERHGVAIDEDDPALMLVTLHEGFLADYERLLERHGNALAEVMTDVGEVTTDAVRDALEVLRAEALEGTLRNTMARISEEARLIEGFLSELRVSTKKLNRSLIILSIISWIAALVVLAAIFFVLTHR